MAGLGSRFSEVGYTAIKPLISVNGRPMIQYAIDSVGIDGNWVFIVQKLHRELYDLDRVMQELCPGCKLVESDGLSQGAACSVLLAQEHIDPAQPLIIINSDNAIQWDSESVFREFIASSNTGLILCFQATDPKWSFAKLNDQGLVIEVAEKRAISNIATAGLYVWKTGAQFIESANAMIQKNIRVNNEFYVCPVYNEDISRGHGIAVHMVDSMDGLGTPEDLDAFLRKTNGTL